VYIELSFIEGLVGAACCVKYFVYMWWPSVILSLLVLLHQLLMSSDFLKRGKVAFLR
jgi:CHASE2 domain-containing sensor protein